MAPAAKSKPKVKSSGRVNAKDKVLLKSKILNGSSGVAGSAYNPELGAFHVLEETDDHSADSSLGVGAEYDSISNNDTCSVESEDQQKEKPHSSTARLEHTPGPDNDKREKIRQKNEKKHQRQKERRAQELHDRCSGYLMSRKLETLAQQLVGMGFTLERATMALIVNDGRLEQSVAWLFESGEESISAQHKNPSPESGSNLKIDITEELACVAEMEVKFKCSKQEVEREIVASEGDLDKAADALRTLYPEHAGAPPQPEESGNVPVGSYSKPLDPVSIVNTVRFQVKPPGMAVPMAFQQRRDIMAGPATVAEYSNRNVQSSRRNLPPKPGAADWARPLQQQALQQSQRQWVIASSSNPLPSYSVASSSHDDPLPTKVEGSRYVGLPSTEGKTLQGSTLREPVMMMQRPQSINSIKHSHPGVGSVSTSLSTTPSWPQNGVDSTDLLKANGTLSRLQNMSLNTGNSAMQHFNHQPQYQPFHIDSAGGGAPRIKPAGTRSSSATRPVPTSLGFFPVRSTGMPGSTSYVDWSMGDSMPLCDYRNVDWSMNIGPSIPNHDGFWNEQAGHSMSNMTLNDGWADMAKMNGAKGTMSPGIFSGLQDGSSLPFNQIRMASPAAGSQEWTSLAAANDLLGMSRQYSTPSR